MIATFLVLLREGFVHSDVSADGLAALCAVLGDGVTGEFDLAPGLFNRQIVVLGLARVRLHGKPSTNNLVLIAHFVESLVKPCQLLDLELLG